MNFALGLTGSIGMGKSTTANLFRSEGCKIWDADAAVHRLYGPGGVAVGPIQVICPKAVEDGQVSRPALKDWIRVEPTALAQIEQIVHPLVLADRNSFKADNPEGILVFDIPLLFENNAQSEFDAVACVHVDNRTQRKRVLDRPNMTAEQFDFIVAKQMSIAQKLELSDYPISTENLEGAKAAVTAILADIRKKMQHA